MKKEKSFEELKSERLFEELTGDFYCKFETYLENKKGKAPSSLVKEDFVFSKTEYKVLKLVEVKLKKFLQEKKRVFEKK